MHLPSLERLISLSFILSCLSSQVSARPSHQHIHPRIPQNHLQLQRKYALEDSVKPSRVARNARPATTYPAGIASATAIVVPHVKSNGSQQLSTTSPDMNYLPDSDPSPELWLPKSMQELTEALDQLTMAYPMDANSGSLMINSTNQANMKSLGCAPKMSRDGGKGGYLDGHKLFIFADTETSSSCTPDGGFAGFVSTSAAVDNGNEGISGQPLNLQDGSGEWATNFGTMRGFIPMTEGEAAFTSQNNNSMRYAIWPDASIIPYDGKSAFLYAPIVFLDGDNETYAGSTLSSISVPGVGGPVAERIAPKLFMGDEPEWGTVGGIRSYGESGPGNSDGLVYIFAKGTTGLLLARTAATTVADRNSYEFYQGGGPEGTFSKTMPSKSSPATFVQGSFTAVDIFYSPRHLTFICVYQDDGLDSTIFWKYLNATKPIVPKYEGGDEVDIVQNIYQYEWIDQGPLYQPAPSSGGRAYNGAVHAGYFDADDITNGGNKMLIAWIAPTGGAMDTAAAGYDHFSASIEFN